MKSPQSYSRSRSLVYEGVSPAEGTLLEVLATLLPQKSRTGLKQALRDRCVRLDGEVTSLATQTVSRGAKIEVFSSGFPAPLVTRGIETLFLDDYFIAVAKGSGIPTISQGKGHQATLFSQVAHHFKEANRQDKIFLLNRLDRETPGIILLARTREVQQEILDHWQDYILAQTFRAIVSGAMDDEGILPKAQTSRKKQKGENSPFSRRSQARYKTIARGEYRTLIEISLEGRYNGIRTQLQELGHPILYPTTDGRSIISSPKGLALIQTSLVLRHPISGKRIELCIEEPAFFRTLMQERLTLRQKEAIQKAEETSRPTSKKEYH